MKSNPGMFSMAASKAYKCLGENNKKDLLEQAKDARETSSAVTAGDIIKAGTKIFKKIQVLVSIH